MKTLLLIALFFQTFSAYATYNMETRWCSEDGCLSYIGNYGTPLGETIRMNDEREKAYHIFNILRESGEDFDHEISVFTGEQLDIESIVEDKQIEFETKEKFNPVFDGEYLYFQKWENGKLNLYRDENKLYSSEEFFKFLGKENGHLLIRDRGRIKLHHGEELNALESLKEYSVSFLRWIDEGRVLCYAERDMDGRRHLILASVHEDELLDSYSVPDGTFLDAAVSSNLQHLYYYSGTSQSYVLHKYHTDTESWEIHKEFSEPVRLLGVRGEEVVWWDPKSEEVKINAVGELKINEHENLKLFPAGEYKSGEHGARLMQVEPDKLLVLFYPTRDKDFLKEKGLGRIEKFRGNNRTWLLPENYMSSFQALPEKMGHAFLSLEDMKIYYDKEDKALRNIFSLKIRPTASRYVVLLILGGVLLLLILSELFRKTKDFVK